MDINVFVSPYSLSTALAMAYNGAVGQTEAEMRDVLSYGSMSLDQMNSQQYNLIKSLEGCDVDVSLAIANSLWIREGFNVHQDFKDRLTESYESEVQELDFDLSSAPDIINQWVEDNTNGKITDLIAFIDPAEMLFLINALYFKANWTTQFDPEKTVEMDFHLLDGSNKPVQMMSMEQQEFGHYASDSFSLIRLPYGREVVAMYIFLPHPDNDINTFFDDMSAAGWMQINEAFEDMTYGRIDLYLPKFKMEYEVKYNDVLKAMGMPSAFSGSAEFDNITALKPFFINYVKQKTFIEVNEEGTEAAATTAVSGTAGGPLAFMANRPFFFVIRDDRSETILFMGRITDPEY